jgi:Tfp pilus assembly protein PilX
MAPSRQNQKGAVSLFIVIFASLLIVTIVTAFVRIMIQDQQQATASDLSKSAMDSAQAGVEDAKRALVEYYKKKCDSQTEDDRCNALRSTLLEGIDENGWTTDCDTTSRAGIAPPGDEVKVQTTSDDETLDQAYTCVKIQMNPENYVGTGTSQLIHLNTEIDEETGERKQFNKIKVEWYVQQDDQALNLSNATINNYELLDSWPSKRPQVLRLQLLQYGEDFAVTDFDDNYQNNATLFLLPTANGPMTTTFAIDFRKSRASGSAHDAYCLPQPERGDYACEMTITLPDLGDEGSDDEDDLPSRHAYLKVDQLYASGNKQFSLTLLDDANEPVRLSDVQVVVDATGRANDIFKRIQSRVDLGGSIPTPDAAVDITRSFCKEFLVTDSTAYPGRHSDQCPLP